MLNLNQSWSSASRIQWVARGLMATLWAAGSAYLIAYALAQPQPSWIEVATIPALWAAVIAAPIIAHHALGNRDVTAAVLLVAASLIGSAWTLSGTIGRQSEGADERVAASTQIERQRRDLSVKLGEAVEILGKYRKVQAVECASGLGKRCDGISYTVQTWNAAVDGYEAKLKALPPPRQPEAGAKRIAALIALLPGVTKPAAQLEADVRLIAPTLFGVFIELAALAFGFFGFRREKTAAAPALLSAPALQVITPANGVTPEAETAIGVEGEAVPTTRRKLTKVQAEARVVVLRRPTSQNALARRWGVTEAAVSQWVGEWEDNGVVERVRRGHCKFVLPASRRARARTLRAA